MASLYLNDGTVEYISDAEGFQKVVYEKLGYDAEQRVKELIELSDFNTHKVDSDLLSYESQLDENRDVFQEILYKIENILECLEAKRVNKDKIRDLLQGIENQIDNQI